MQTAPVVAGMQRHSMRVTEREPERLARRMPRMRRDIPRRRHNEHEVPPANTIAFKTTLHRRRTAVAETLSTGPLCGIISAARCRLDAVRISDDTGRGKEGRSMQYKGVRRLPAGVVAMMVAVVLLFESYVFAHSGFMSDRAFSSASDIVVFLVCPALPFVVLAWLARRREVDRHAEARAQGVFFSGLATCLLSAYVFFRFVKPIGWGMDQGTGKVFVLLLPLVAVPASLVLYAIGYGCAVTWKRHRSKDGRT